MGGGGCQRTHCDWEWTHGASPPDSDALVPRLSRCLCTAAFLMPYFCMLSTTSCTLHGLFVDSINSFTCASPILTPSLPSSVSLSLSLFLRGTPPPSLASRALKKTNRKKREKKNGALRYVRRTWVLEEYTHTIPKLWFVWTAFLSTPTSYHFKDEFRGIGSDAVVDSTKNNKTKKKKKKKNRNES